MKLGAPPKRESIRIDWTKKMFQNNLVNRGTRIDIDRLIISF